MNIWTLVIIFIGKLLLHNKQTQNLSDKQQEAFISDVSVGQVAWDRLDWTALL